MRTLLTVILAILFFLVAGCGQYVLKSDIEKRYILKERVQEDYILKSKVEEDFIPKSEVSVFYARVASNHKCRLRVNPNQYIDFCFPYCPVNPYIQDLGIPCP